MQHGFPCQQCGATLSYAPGTEFLRCSYCGFENEIGTPAGDVSEQDFHAALEDAAAAQATEEHITVKCDSCAAEFDFDEHIHADECPFCGSTIVADTGRQRVIKPRSLLPFHVSDRDARALFRGWVKSLWFAPGKVKKYVRDEQKLMGMYVPYWTFDSNTVSRYRGMRGDFYQVPEQYVATVNGKRVVRTRMVTKVRWAPAGGTVSRWFDDVLVLASHSLPRRIINELTPWDLENLTSYREDYLSGFRSEVYQIALDEGFRHAREEMDRIIRIDVARDIGGDQQRIDWIDTRFSDISFKHILLPMWLAAFRFSNKTYRFAINGRSGEVQGERPYSFWKIAFAVLAVILLVVVVFLLAGQGQLDGGNYELPSYQWKFG